MHKLESQIQREIVLALNRLGYITFRNNTGEGWSGTVNKERTTRRVMHLRNARRIAYGLCVGSSDLIGWAPDGTFLAVEVKQPGNYPSPAQRDFISTVTQLGGIAIWANSVDMAKEKLANFTPSRTAGQDILPEHTFDDKHVNACYHAARKAGAAIWRNNRGVFYPGKTIATEGDSRSLCPYSVVTAGLTNGASDFIGLDSRGKFLAIEIKEGSGRPSEKQKNFIAAVNRVGGRALVLSRPDQLEGITL